MDFLNNREKERREIKQQIQTIKEQQAELELTYKEKWHAVKDFQNSVGDVLSFQKWAKNVYKPQKSGLAIQLRNAIEKHDSI